MTNDEKKMLRVVAAYNDCTEEQAKERIVKEYLAAIVKDGANIKELKLPELTENAESPKAEKPSVKALINQALKEAGTVEEIQLLVATRRELSELERRRKEQAAELETKAETPERPKRKGGRPRKSVNQFVEEVHQADKMSKDEFVEYFGGKG